MAEELCAISLAYRRQREDKDEERNGEGGRGDLRQAEVVAARGLLDALLEAMHGLAHHAHIRTLKEDGIKVKRRKGEKGKESKEGREYSAPS